jgi:hypothetical protein
VIDTDALPPTQYLVLEVLAARHRSGEHMWTFPSRLGPALRALEHAGLVSVMHGIAPRTLRARLTEAGEDASMSAVYNKPVPTLDEGLATLPTENEQYLAWMRDHGLGHGAGIATVISAVRADLRKLTTASDPSGGPS